MMIARNCNRGVFPLGLYETLAIGGRMLGETQLTLGAMDVRCPTIDARSWNRQRPAATPNYGLFRMDLLGRGD
jgi:hypothetical protein